MTARQVGTLALLAGGVPVTISGSTELLLGVVEGLRDAASAESRVVVFDEASLEAIWPDGRRKQFTDAVAGRAYVAAENEAREADDDAGDGA